MYSKRRCLKKLHDEQNFCQRPSIKLINQHLNLSSMKIWKICTNLTIFLLASSAYKSLPKTRNVAKTRDVVFTPKCAEYTYFTMRKHQKCFMNSYAKFVLHVHFHPLESFPLPKIITSYCKNLSLICDYSRILWKMLLLLPHACRQEGSTVSIHFWTTWLPFWSFTHFTTFPSSS